MQLGLKDVLIAYLSHDASLLVFDVLGIIGGRPVSCSKGPSDARAGPKACGVCWQKVTVSSKGLRHPCSCVICTGACVSILRRQLCLAVRLVVGVVKRPLGLDYRCA